jgi:hypothetical protein
MRKPARPPLWPYVCFECRHVFKGPGDYSVAIDWRACPLCHTRCVRLGQKFKAPWKDDLKQWEKVRFLVEHGFLFYSIRLTDGTTAKYPSTLVEARAFVERFAAFAVPANEASAIQQPPG